MDAQGILQACFDPARLALRTFSVADIIQFTPGDFITVAGAPTIVATNDYPRAQFADGVTTTVAVTFSTPAYWTAATAGFWFTSTVAGNNVRWRMALKKTALFIDNISAAFGADVSATVAAPGTAGVLHSQVQVPGINVSPQAFGSYYTLILSRIGADAADTNTGTAEVPGIYLVAG